MTVEPRSGVKWENTRYCYDRMSVLCVDLIENIWVVRLEATVKLSRGLMSSTVSMASRLCNVVHALSLETIEEVKDAVGRMEIIMY